MHGLSNSSPAEDVYDKVDYVCKPIQKIQYHSDEGPFTDAFWKPFNDSNRQYEYEVTCGEN